MKQNRIISISSRVIEFWCFGLPVALGVGGWVDGGGGWLGVPPTHVHMHAHAHMCIHTHACMVSMIFSCKWPPPLGESLEFPMMSYAHARACACMHMHVHVCGVHPLTTPPPPSTHPPTPQGGTPGISQNSIALELIEIFQFHLKI